MRAVKSQDTRPEMAVRRAVRALGVHYRLHRKDLPGKPDLAFIGRRKAVFVHGCFWHRHPDCKIATTPKTNTEFWIEKFEKNKERDVRARKALEEAGWSTLVVWECELDSMKKAVETGKRIGEKIKMSAQEN